MREHNFPKFWDFHHIQPLILMGIRTTSLAGKFALTLFVAKFMGFEALGLYGLITAVSIIAPSVLGLALMYSLSRKAVIQAREQIADEMLYYAQYTLLLYTMLACIALVVSGVTGNWFLTFVFLTVIFFEHINNDLYTLQLNLSRPFAANILHFIRSGLWMFIFMGAAFFFPEFRTMQALLVGWGSGSALALIGFFWTVRDWPWRPALARKPLKSWILEKFRESRTIYVNELATAASQYLNHFLITLLLGISLTGVYVYFMQIVGALSNLVRTGVIQVARPKMVKAFSERDPDFTDLYAKTMKNAVGTAVLMAIVAAPVMYYITFHLIDRPLAEEWLSLFWFMLLSFIIMTMREVNTLFFYSRNEDNIILKQSLWAIGVLLVSNPLFIPFVGLWAPIITSTVLSIVLLFYSRRYVQTILIK